MNPWPLCAAVTNGAWRLVGTPEPLAPEWWKHCPRDPRVPMPADLEGDRG